MELLRHLGRNPGVAVVVVHHLHPGHESNLASVLSRACDLLVHVAGGQALEPNHVYVQPPNTALVLDGGRLVLSPQVVEAGARTTIDRFFESLALDKKGSAIAVLLSGMGSDRALGIRAVKAEGGVTFAQDASAEYPSMPEAAIATGCVDFVSSPEQIARRIVAIQANGSIVEREPAEALALSEDSLLRPGSFFADARAFEALKRRVFPTILRNLPRGAPIRVWVPDCSSGEAVYSTAICLLEFLEGRAAASIP